MDNYRRGYYRAYLSRFTQFKIWVRILVIIIVLIMLIKALDLADAPCSEDPLVGSDNGILVKKPIQKIINKF